MSFFEQIILTHQTKGIPGCTSPFPIERISEQRWNVLRQDMPLPLAVLKETSLANNARWIAEFAHRAGVSLCPHGKTTMSPKIFHRQLRDGAWGITLSTAHQVHVARDAGISRILLANQLIDPVFLEYLLDELRRDPGFDFYCLVDSLEGVSFLQSRIPSDTGRPLQLLVEVGMMGGRTGCRTPADALAVARAAHMAGPKVALRGIEGFEGIVPSVVAADPKPVESFLQVMKDIAVAAAREKLFFDGEVILSAGGSAYFDLVARSLSEIEIGLPRRVVLRSGCYVSHDSDMYVSYFNAIKQRSDLAREIAGTLVPAIEIITYVQSRPEPALAVLTAGKRDCSYDHHLPTPIALYRPGRDRSPISVPTGCAIVNMNDQHSYMQIPSKAVIDVGDIVICGISHPCTTFDKWDVLYGVDDRYNVVSAFKTFF